MRYVMFAVLLLVGWNTGCIRAAEEEEKSTPPAALESGDTGAPVTKKAGSLREMIKAGEIGFEFNMIDTCDLPNWSCYLLFVPRNPELSFQVERLVKGNSRVLKRNVKDMMVSQKDAPDCRIAVNWPPEDFTSDRTQKAQCRFTLGREVLVGHFVAARSRDPKKKAVEFVEESYTDANGVTTEEKKGD